MSVCSCQRSPTSHSARPQLWPRATSPSFSPCRTIVARESWISRGSAIRGWKTSFDGANRSK